MPMFLSLNTVLGVFLDSSSDQVCTFPRQHRSASCASLRGTHKSNKENIR